MPDHKDLGEILLLTLNFVTRCWEGHLVTDSSACSGVWSRSCWIVKANYDIFRNSVRQLLNTATIKN